MLVNDLMAGSALIWPSYEEQMNDYLRFYSKVTSVITIALILAGTLLDHFYYPEHYSEFLACRVVASILIGAALWLAYRLNSNLFRVLSITWACVPQIMICFMILRTGGEESIYFVGLTYAFTGVAAILPISIMESLAFIAFTLILYIGSCLAGTGQALNENRLAGNLVFLSFSAVIMIVITTYGDRWRRKTYAMQLEIQKQNTEIASQNTQLKETKVQLVHNEKMAALGTLSAGMLHELNNPINYAAIASTLTCEALEKRDIEEAKDTLADAVEGIARVKSIVGDLKAFAYQKGTGNPLDGSFNLLEAVRIAGRMTAHERGNIAFGMEIPSDLWVKGDKASIGSVIINLLSNSAKALREAGRGEAGRISVRASIIPGSRRVAVTVFDNGAGISHAIISRIFEPFFSTSAVGEGIGLGLSISYAIIKRHQSELVVKSLHGEYTEFSFQLEQANAEHQ